MPPAEQNELNKALVKFQAKLKGAKKDAINPAFKRPGSPEGSRYADLESVWQAAIDAGLTECGLAISQDVGYHYCGYGQDGEVIDTLTTELRHESGQMKSSTMRIFSAATPQSQGSAITYARRYAMAALLGIYQVDDDANEAEAQRPKSGTNTRAQSADGSRSPSSSQAGGQSTAKSTADKPPCPECGMLNLREDRNNAGNWYCWLKSDPPGCGYKGPKAAETFSDKKEAAEQKKHADAVTADDLKGLTKRVAELGFSGETLKAYIFEEFALDEVTPETLWVNYTRDMMKRTEAHFIDLAQTGEFLHAVSEEPV